MAWSSLLTQHNPAASGNRVLQEQGEKAMIMKSRLGAKYLGDSRCQFVVWAPFTQKVEVHIMAPQERILPLDRDAQGYHRAIVEGVEPGSLYLYRLDGEEERPDPASRFQPQSCLLYTSPSPRDRQRSRMPSSA